MIEIKKLMKKYNNDIILNISYFKFNKGNSYIIVGSNGSGKSTLIKCILGINKIDNGYVNINTKNIGYVPERYYFPDFCSVKKFLECILEIYDKQKNKYLINYYCDYFALEKNRLLNKLSKGMMQKTLVIQSLIHDADLFIFDEPLSGLDTPSQIKFLKIINELKEKGKTIIIVTHYPEFYKFNYDYYIRIKDRKLIYENH